LTLVLYDTNIVVSLLSPTDALHHAAARTAEAWEARGARTAISVVSWAELRTGALRRGPDAEQALAAFCRVAVDEIVPVSVEIAEIAAGYRAVDLSIRMPDALVVATGRHIGADVVLTGDKQMARAAPKLVALVVPG
jgi:predicted nucleic acid-binding protein